MTHIPLPNLLPEDVQSIVQTAQGAMLLTDSACTSTSLNEIDQQQTKIEEAQSGLETLLSFLTREKNQLLASIEAVKAMSKDLDRHSKRCTRSYWLVKNSLPKA
jgi:hypothetical protein